MSDSNAPIMVTCQADRNFVTILNAYRHLKIIKKLTLVSVLIIMTVPFAWGISSLAVFLTLALCLATLAYLVVSICLRSVTDQVKVDDQIQPNED